MQISDSPTSLLCADVADSLSILGGNLAADRPTVFGIFRNEMYFVVAFLAHYRSLGAEQFLILDDSSDDGTREYLLAQPDCVVLQSSLAFGQIVIVRDANNLKERAGTLLKSAIPRKYLAGQWALYADADEFAFLPPGAPSLRALFSYLDGRGARSAVASLVDFYPLDASGYDKSPTATGLADLLMETPYFDATQLFVVPAGKQPERIGFGASMRLFDKFRVKEVDLRGQPGDQPKFRTPPAAYLKTPVLKWDDDVRLEGSHYANILPPPDIVLTLAHFKFGADIVRRTASAMQLKSHSNKSRKYFHYKTLIERLRETKGDFLGPTSKRFRGVEDFIDAKLMVVPADLGADTRPQ